MGLDAQWNDDLHHALHAVVTGERQGYYGDFGKFEQLLKALREGFVYSGEFSEFRKRRHGNSSRDIPAHRLVVFAQNHDQVGNRRRGDRLTLPLPDEALKMMAGVILLSPYLPLLFMGEEYGETAPFPFFISHSDPDLIEAVRKGRRAEWSSEEGQDEAPDPQDEKTFTSARLNHALRHAQGPHRMLWEFYRRLIELRTRIRGIGGAGRRPHGGVRFEPAAHRLPAPLEPGRGGLCDFPRGRQGGLGGHPAAGGSVGQGTGQPRRLLGGDREQHSLQLRILR